MTLSKEYLGVEYYRDKLGRRQQQGTFQSHRKKDVEDWIEHRRNLLLQLGFLYSYDHEIEVIEL